MIRLALAPVLLLFLFSAQQCNEHPESIPDCTQSLIEGLKNEPIRNPPAKIIKYVLDKKAYFYVPPNCCDAYSDLYDADCNLVCHPDGGITGRGDMKCTELASQISKLKGEVVWEDKR